jgi:hypothetical protein
MSNFKQSQLSNGGKLTVGIADNKQKESLMRAIGEGYIEVSDINGTDNLQKRIEDLGLVYQFNQLDGCQKDGTIQRAIMNNAVIEADEIRYKNVIKTKGMYVKDVLTEGEKLGYKGSTFEVVMSFAPRQGDVYTADLEYGTEFMVSLHHEPVSNGDGSWTTVCHMPKDTDPNLFVSRSELANSTNLIKVNNSKNEHGVNMTGVNLEHKLTEIERLFKLGDRQGADIAYSDDAGFIMSDSNVISDITELNMMAKEMEDKYFVSRMDFRNGPSTAYALPGILYLLGRETMRMIEHTIMHSQGVNRNTGNGIIYQPKGLWYQAKEGGKNIFYNNKASLMNSLIEASEYIYGRGRSIPIEDRKMEIECGKNFYYAVRELFKDEFNRGNPMVMTPEAFPNPILSKGSSPYKFIYNGFVIEEAMLPGIGIVKLKHNPSFDMGSGNPQFQTRGGYSRGADRAVIWDCMSQLTSNIKRLEDYGLKTKDMGEGRRYNGANILLVKQKKAPMIAFGEERGRSMMGGRGGTHGWTHGKYATGRASAMLVDPTNTIIFEKEYI